jgi:hypothetical protein
MLNLASHQQLEKAAKKLKMNNAEYASAAIAYFAKSGLDPREEHLLDGPLTRSKISEGVANVRAHNADIGNRLFALTRGFEKTMYLFMQQQEHNMNVYLEGIEGNLMKRLVLMEDSLLQPLVERVLRGNQEAHLGRGIGMLIYQAMSEKSPSWGDQNKIYTKELEENLAKELKEFMTDHPIPPAKSTKRPAATPVPAATPLPPKTIAPAATPPKS